MATKYTAYCKNCCRETFHERPSTSHILHLLLSLVTMGFWVPVWILMALNNNSQGMCTICGRKVGLFGSGGGGIKHYTPVEINNNIKCPECAELIKPDAKVCKHCGFRLKEQ